MCHLVTFKLPFSHLSIDWMIDILPEWNCSHHQPIYLYTHSLHRLYVNTFLLLFYIRCILRLRTCIKENTVYTSFSFILLKSTYCMSLITVHKIWCLKPSQVICCEDVDGTFFKCHEPNIILLETFISNDVYV